MGGVNPSTPSANNTDPPSGNKDVGWVPGYQPPAQWMNWFQYTVYLWAYYIQQWTANLFSTTNSWTIIQNFTAGISANSPGGLALAISGSSTTGGAIKGVTSAAQAAVAGVNTNTAGIAVGGTASGTGVGVFGQNLGTGVGVEGFGGTTSGPGGVFIAQAGNSDGMDATGAGTGIGATGTGGSSNGTGVAGIGGGTTAPES